jgi:predicted nucleic acid-binding protein
VGALLGRYAEVPMSLADACLVRMAERHAKSRVLTLDRDFRIYRKHRRHVIPTTLPPQEAP